MLKRFIIFLLIACPSCQPAVTDDNQALEEFEKQLNQETEKRIDAAYARIQAACDSLMQTNVPIMVDSLIQSTDHL